MPKSARLARYVPLVIVAVTAVVLISPGAAVAGGCSNVSHTTTFGGYNRDTLSARLCWNGTSASIGNVGHSCQVIEDFSDCTGFTYSISGNYSTSSATVYGTFWGTGPDNSYEAVIRITIKPNGSSSWGWYYIYEV